MRWQVHLNSPLCGLPPHRNALDWSSWRRLWPRPGFLFGANHAGKPLSFCPSYQTQTKHTESKYMFPERVSWLFPDYTMCVHINNYQVIIKSLSSYLFGDPAVFSCCAALLIQEGVEVRGFYAAAVPVFVSRQWTADVNYNAFPLSSHKYW